MQKIPQVSPNVIFSPCSPNVLPKCWKFSKSEAIIKRTYHLIKNAVSRDYSGCAKCRVRHLFTKQFQIVTNSTIDCHARKLVTEYVSKNITEIIFLSPNDRGTRQLFADSIICLARNLSPPVRWLNRMIWLQDTISWRLIKFCGKKCI